MFSTFFAFAVKSLSPARSWVCHESQHHQADGAGGVWDVERLLMLAEGGRLSARKWCRFASATLTFGNHTSATFTLLLAWRFQNWTCFASLSLDLSLSLSGPLSLCLTHSLTRSLARWLAGSLARSLCLSLALSRSLSHSLTHSLLLYLLEFVEFVRALRAPSGHGGDRGREDCGALD